MYAPDQIIDERYVVTGTCSEGGGMGALLFVKRLGRFNAPIRVLKYCKDKSEESIKRFRREVRLMTEFKGNGKVMQVMYSNLDHEPPYFVMDYFEDGDLAQAAPRLRTSLEAQEKIFNDMIDCIAELHAVDVFHRDIKPQNFLLDGEDLVVSDLGLSTENDSATVFTRSTMGWGTPGYLPPEFSMPGGFKNADAASDIFMLGKAFYFILSGRDPTYLLSEHIPKPLMVVIERCCAPHKAGRYQTLASLKQSLSAAYDVLLNRVVGSALAARSLRTIVDRLKTANRYRPTEIIQFIDQLAMLDDGDKSEIGLELPKEIFPIIGQEAIQSHHRLFLASYKVMVEAQDYGFSFAETIATNMRSIFDGDSVQNADKAEALRIAITGAHSQNRFAAMETCKEMIRSVIDDELAQHVHDVINEFAHTFIVTTEPSSCRASAIKSALHALKNKSKTIETEDDDF